MSEPERGTPTAPDQGPADASDAETDAAAEAAEADTVRRLRLAMAGLAVVIAGAAAAVWVTDRDGPSVATVPESTQPVETSDGSSVEPTSPTEGLDITSMALWPWASSAQRFEDPVAAARSFAVDYVGFVDPVIGEFRQGDPRSGEVDVRPDASGPITTVFVRQLDAAGSWGVLGSVTANIDVREPVVLSAIRSPVVLKGSANAIEGRVPVQLRVDGQAEPVAEGAVMGSMGSMGPFETSVPFDDPAGAYGAVVFRTFSMKDGSVQEATVLRVAFAKG